ncbi:hypothetical protein L1987_30768 [Smallanthus sonchifolius]|uniref:Uncharacterized protein n=1 Tax=Smallanthus sonchifolius TaxID=185202 RepID=A0ACB9I327_9ASTR|nr:hypothetical protein L1987_30768 [Smallanthus sonchifolius]
MASEKESENTDISLDDDGETVGIVVAEFRVAAAHPSSLELCCTSIFFRSPLHCEQRRVTKFVCIKRRNLTLSGV